MKFLTITLGLAVVGSAIAATPKITTDSDPSASFATYKTYYWAMKPQGPSPLMQQRIVDSIDSQLQGKGWTLADKGDVAVAAHVTTQQKQTLDTMYMGSPLGGWGWRGGFGGGMGMGTATTDVHTYEVGTLVVDMFDSKTQKAIWRGTATGTVSTSPEKMQDSMEKGLQKMFQNFPPGSAAPAR